MAERWGTVAWPCLQHTSRIVLKPNKGTVGANRCSTTFGLWYWRTEQDQFEISKRILINNLQEYSVMNASNAHTHAQVYLEYCKIWYENGASTFC